MWKVSSHYCSLSFDSFFLSWVKNPTQSLGTQDTVLNRCPPTYGDGPAGLGRNSLSWNVCHGELTCMIDHSDSFFTNTSLFFQKYDRDFMILHNTFVHHLSFFIFRWHRKPNIITQDPRLWDCPGLLTTKLTNWWPPDLGRRVPSVETSMFLSFEYIRSKFYLICNYFLNAVWLTPLTCPPEVPVPPVLDFHV